MWQQVQESIVLDVYGSLQLDLQSTIIQSDSQASTPNSNGEKPDLLPANQIHSQ